MRQIPLYAVPCIGEGCVKAGRRALLALLREATGACASSCS